VHTNDDVKKYWNNRPCNINHSSAEIGTAEYVRQVAAKRYYVEPHITEFANFKSYRGKNVLEIGSGIGTDAISFASNGANVFSGDISDNSVDISRKNAASLNLKNLIFFEHDFQNSQLPVAAEFDLIYSFGVIHHSPNPQIIFNNLKQWAGPNTEIKIMVYYKYSTKAIALYLRYGFLRKRSFDEAVAVQSEAQKNSPYTFTYSKKTITAALESAGLEVSNIKIRHIFPYAIKEYKRNIYSKRWYWKGIPMKFIKQIGKLFGWHLLVEANIK
jgi:cyclopropane fatty-acyl-phospholipid synthase-like methyltransferase